MRFAGTQMTNFMGDTMDFSKVANESILGRGRERQAAMQSEGLVANAGIKSVGAVQSAGYKAEAIRAAGAAQGQASMASGIGSLASGIVGGFASMPSSGSSYSFDPAGSQGNPFGTGPRIREGGY